MKQVGQCSLPSTCLRPSSPVLNPWVALGIVFLLGFLASYLTALSWADLTYVLPATSFGYVLMMLIANLLA